ncbi:hypothetical protein BJI69_13070 [Luteibacter rhizovicinus DSM 16549]|uniref:Uncharacterized protein n=1 Tax=Luteibacter rhizovicinus DSM 16549 TaxID=1440763 RepID=A0A0G9HFK3_9GAMM|nr:hypothetical protein [Luteibacter rhizovicinus]APG04736.1 hypothetical protein BJI69_13070 [Luteibacter rhizovicinus DSM 16549]KLD68226.1 hypothetical protein Y883_03810 [Luteibacter rhizovicinus DSM 16549]KLD78852.1 hypothetical protein Y886_07955 [Xanthomonas hyacinthi DSM 19077]
MRYKQAYDREVTMTDRERVVYRLLIGVVVLTSVVAGLATFFASSYESVWDRLNAIVDSVPMIPARYWASGSDFPDLSAIYFFWSWPVFPASGAALAVRFWTPNDMSWAGRVNSELKLVLGCLVMLATGLSILWSLDGAEVMGVPIGARLADLLMVGWAPFAMGGCLTGLGVLGFRRLLGPSTSTRGY